MVAVNKRSICTVFLLALALIAAFAVAYPAYADDFAVAKDRSDNDLDATIITRSTKKVVVDSVYAFEPGDTVFLTIGGKTYRKTPKAGKHSVKFKIKKQKVWKKVIVELFDSNGIEIGKSYKSRVYYAKSIKKGMTKKQVRYTYEYGKPDFTLTLKGGYPAWFYWDEDASGTYCVVFKNGRVVSFD